MVLDGPMAFVPPSPIQLLRVASVIASSPGQESERLSVAPLRRRNHSHPRRRPPLGEDAGHRRHSDAGAGGRCARRAPRGAAGRCPLPRDRAVAGRVRCAKNMPRGEGRIETGERRRSPPSLSASFFC